MNVHHFTITRRLSCPHQDRTVSVTFVAAIDMVSSVNMQAFISLDITLQDSNEEAGDDPDFEPDFNLSSDIWAALLCHMTGVHEWLLPIQDIYYYECSWTPESRGEE
ncbi:hypothetical protein MAR_008827 [Mya arenaria]|uniref:Uncharacterized protein n=1 Tax=Mya arenaria TaxID=6604 RepID=A0ABY7E1G9_MYAAR|nr:hypothetical protein MAR_008827 [Mya arenaria]